MNVRAVVAKFRFEDKGRRISSVGRGRMVAARVSAFRLDVFDGAVLRFLVNFALINTSEYG